LREEDNVKFMEWTRSDTIALAADSCAQCHGLGLRSDDKDLGAPSQPCNCVLRTIFRACHARFRECATKEKFISRVSLEAVQGKDRRGTWSRKDEEYLADFCLVSRRSLTDGEYRIFKYHFLLGADWKLCCRKLKTDRGSFFHAVYNIQQKLGRIYRELQPYALYPLGEYFHGATKPVEPTFQGLAKVIPIRPPVITRPAAPQPIRKVA
jgi:hypothetical protein